MGLEDAFHHVYPKAHAQRCVVHKMRNTFPKIRVKDKVEFMADLKNVYTAPTHDKALRQFQAPELKWGKVYPRELESWRADLPVLLTFYKFPEDVWASIYTTNAIERTIKELRKRLYPMRTECGGCRENRIFGGFRLQRKVEQPHYSGLWFG